ncbi:MAG: flagellar assembly protein FliH [Telluria sp.]
MNTPKEQLTAYQRWEMESFGDERPSVVAKRPPPVELPTQQMVDQILENARAEGYEEGRAAGYADGLAMGRAEAATERAHLQSIAAEFAQAVAQADETIAADVLDLAVQLARSMLRTALEVKPELILPVIREAIGYLPVAQQPAVLSLNPDDVQLVHDAMGEELDKGGWQIKADAAVGRGGCKIETASNQIDAQAASRWQRLAHAVGRDTGWLE